MLSPAATPIADSLEWTCEAWLGVLDALEAIHSMGFVHMDVSLSNLLVVSPHQIMLNDFGSCWAAGRVVTSWTDIFAAEAVLLDSKRTPQFAHDLHSYIKCYYVLTHGGFNQSITLATEGRKDGYKQLLKFWQHNLQGDEWQSVLQAATQCQYQTLRDFFRNRFTVYRKF